jgi:hypothetical protein
MEPTAATSSLRARVLRAERALESEPTNEVSGLGPVIAAAAVAWIVVVALVAVAESLLT